MNIKIGTLEEFPNYIETIAQIASEEFGLTKEFYLSSFVNAKTFLAFHYGCLVGFVCIDKEDLNYKKYKQINNWLADLYVLKPFRKKGIASKLVDHALQKNEQEEIWTWTEHKYVMNFLLQKGFKVKDMVVIEKKPIFIMSKKNLTFSFLYNFPSLL